MSDTTAPDYRDSNTECPCCSGSGQVTEGEAHSIEYLQAEIKKLMESPSISEADRLRAENQTLQAEVEALKVELSRWERPFDQERFDAAKNQASHADSLAAQGVYITALEHALKHSTQER